MKKEDYIIDDKNHVQNGYQFLVDFENYKAVVNFIDSLKVGYHYSCKEHFNPPCILIRVYHDYEVDYLKEKILEGNGNVVFSRKFENQKEVEWTLLV